MVLGAGLTLVTLVHVGVNNGANFFLMLVNEVVSSGKVTLLERILSGTVAEEQVRLGTLVDLNYSIDKVRLFTV